MLQLPIPFFAFFINAFVQIFYFKYGPEKRLLRSEFCGFLSGVIVFAVFEGLTCFRPVLEWFGLMSGNFIIYLCLSYGYFTFINMGETARRIRLLRELDDAKDWLTEEEILARYQSEELIAIRLKRLLANGQVVLKDEKYYIGNPFMLLLSRMVMFTKVIVMGKGGRAGKF